MRRRALLLLLLGLLAAGRLAAAPAVQVGDAYADVVAKLGLPTSEIDAGPNRLLYYPTVRIKVRAGLVAEVTPVTAPAPAPAPAPGAPTPRPSAAPKAAAARGKKDAVEDEIADFEFGVLQTFRAEDFGALDAQANQLLAERATFGDGSWKIVAFHQALGVPENAPAADWDGVEQKLGRWENAMPKSVSARVAHVSFLTAAAWRARGGLIPADKVAPEALSLFQSRLGQAQALLQRAMDLEPKSPMLWYVGLNLALARHWALGDTVAFYIDGKKFEPGFWYLDTQLAQYLSPHWNGKAGDWEAFAQTECNRTGSMGTEGYARIVYSMKPFYRNVFKETKAQWPEVKDGFQILLKKYPQSLQLVNEYAYMACNAGDREAARAAFDKIGAFVDPYIWTAESIKLFRAWAYQAQ